MPMPTPRDIRAISAAAAKLVRGATAAEAQLRLASELPGYTAAEIASAVRLAVIYRARLANVSGKLAQQAGHGRRGPTDTIGSFIGTPTTGSAVVGIRVYWTGKLVNGDMVEGSTVINVPADASIYRMDFRIRAAIFRGYVTFPNVQYVFETLNIQYQTATPYERSAGFLLDTGDINPYK